MAKQAKYVQAGSSIDWTNPGLDADSNVSVGDVVPLSNGIGIALGDIAYGATGSLKVTDVFELPAINDTAFDVDDILYWDSAASKLTNITGISASEPASAETNTGDGELDTIVVGAGAVAETWTLKCITAATGGGTFSVIGSVSGRMDDTVVGSAYDNGKIAFTITAGTADFVVGDVITIEFTQANTIAGKAVYPKAKTATTAIIDIARR